MTRLLAVVVLALSACGEKPPALGDACSYSNDSMTATCASDGVSWVVCRDGTWHFDYECPSPKRCDWTPPAEGVPTGPACR